MAQDKDTARWVAMISVTLTPVNKYGDKLSGDGSLRYNAELEGSLTEIVGRLERLKQV